MQLGFVSAILPDLTLEEVLAFAADEGFACVEADVLAAGQGRPPVRRRHPPRRDELHAGTGRHVRELAADPRRRHLRPRLLSQPARPGPGHRKMVVEHLNKVIRGRADARRGRGEHVHRPRPEARPSTENFDDVQEVWPPIVAEAKAAGVKIGIEHCPMLFSRRRVAGREEPGDHARRSGGSSSTLFPGDTLGLNFDPSHLVWQFIDCRGRSARVRPADRPRPRQGRADRPRTALPGRRPGPGLAHAEAAGPGRRELGRVLRGADRRRLPRPGVHRGRRPGLRTRSKTASARCGRARSFSIRISGNGVRRKSPATRSSSDRCVSCSVRDGCRSGFGCRIAGLCRSRDRR